MEYLYDKLKTYAESDYYGFHMPGHKRNRCVTGANLPYEIDITEIEGFDDLHHPEGILKKIQQRAAHVFGAEETHYLVNGSTVGLLSAVLGCTSRKGKIIMARNCHKSVYNAVSMNELKPIYIYPEHTFQEGINGAINPDDLRKIVDENCDAEAVVITSPTYDGVVSDVAKIAEIVHNKGIPLIVDEAHGAHFGMHPYFPDHSNKLGADVVIHSLHKTLPSLTQTGLLHMNGPYADRASVRKYLHMLQSSSPSYVLMASIDECVRLLETNRTMLFDIYTECLEKLRYKLKQMKCLQIVETEAYDRSKIVIAVPHAITSSEREMQHEFNGRDLYMTLLERYHLQMEMAASSYVIAMTSLADTEEGFARLGNAMLEIDEMLAARSVSQSGLSNRTAFPSFHVTHKALQESKETYRETEEHLHQVQIYTPYETEKRLKSGKESCTSSMLWENAEGYIAAEYAYLYPPGIPLVVPGERISAPVVRQIMAYRKIGFTIEGTVCRDRIKVLNEGK